MSCLYHILYIHVTTEQLNIAVPEALWYLLEKGDFQKKIGV